MKAKAKGAPQIIKAVQGGYVAREVQMTPEARNAWKRYDRALHELAARPGHPERLDPTYGRLASAAIRIAMALAVCEQAQGNFHTPVSLPVIEIGHWASAQQIVERWRADAHAILAAALREEGAEATQRDSDRLVRFLTDAGGQLGRGDLLRLLHWPAARLDTAIGAARGRVRQVNQQTGGRPAAWVELVQPTPAEDGAVTPVTEHTDFTRFTRSAESTARVSAPDAPPEADPESDAGWEGGEI